MKTLEEIYNEIMANSELKTKFARAAKENKQLEFLKEQGCETTMDELKAFMEKKIEEDPPLSLDELDNAAGGGCNSITKNEVGLSIFTVGVGCALEAISSAVYGHNGQEEDDEGRLCTHDD